MVCKLYKPLYALQQASCNWFAAFSNALLDVGFTQSYNDHSLCFLCHGSFTIFILLYVDDMVLIGNNKLIV